MKQFQPFSIRTGAILSILISFILNFIFLLGLLYARANFPPPDDMRGLTKEIQESGFPYNALLLNFISNFILAFILYWANFKILKTSRLNKNFRLLITIIGTFLLVLVLSYLFSSVRIHFTLAGRHPERFLWSNMVKDMFIAVIVVFSVQLIYLWDKQQRTALENQKLITQNLRTRYEALKNQVDPHFLFNSLNTLNSLIGYDKEKAQEYVQQLSSVFRYTLQNKEIISLDEELEFSRSYFHLMKIRYGDTLRINSLIDDKYLSYYIMPLSLQLLYENAIKHNVISNKYPLTINIETTRDDTIKVFNVMQPKKDGDKGEGIGLANLTERYKLLLQKDILITDKNGIFSVEIPLIISK